LAAAPPPFFNAGAPGAPTAGIDEDELATRPLRVIRHSVTGHSRDILYDSCSAAKDAIDEGGFTDIGPTDDGNNRLGKSLLDVVAGVVAKLGRVRHEGTLLLGD